MNGLRGKGRIYVTGLMIVSVLLVFAGSGSPQSGTPAVTILSPTQPPVQTNLVSDIPGLAITTDPNLVNPWGIANSASSPYWISDQGTDKSTLYNGAGVRSATIVTVPPVGTPSGPTGMVAVASGVTGFDVPGTSTTAHFIFATLDGTIAAWASGANAVTADTIPSASFTGLALANNGSANYLYAANFVSGGTIQIFDSLFHSTTLAASFTDPTLPVGYAPFNIQAVGSNLYVLFAQVRVPGGAQPGAGLGYVDIFDTNGNFVQRLISNGPLNAPWGITVAPAGFQSFPSDLLVGNFGDGKINAFNPTTGSFIGTIDDPEGRPLVNSGLWALEFGNGNAGSSPTTLYFTAGINGQQDGLFGAITPAPPTLTFAGQLLNTPSTAQSLTVENTGSATLNISTITLTGTNATEFTMATGSTCVNGLAVAPGGSCIVNLTFTPGAIGARGPATLTFNDNASSSPQIVALSGTGAAGSPGATLAPPTLLSFSGQLVTTTSAAQTVTVTNTGTAPLTFGALAISVTNDFAQTNTCNGATVAISGTCTISVTFSPSATTNNPRTGTLSIASNFPGSPQTIALGGTGWDFSVSAPSTASTSAGTSAPITVTVGALGGFTGPVTLTCSATIPMGNCAAPATAVNAPGTGTVTISTTAAALAPPGPMQIPTISAPQVCYLLLAFGLASVLFSVRRIRTRLSLAGAILLLLVLAGCSSSSNGTSARTSAGTYPVTVTGTSGGVTRTASVTLTVN